MAFSPFKFLQEVRSETAKVTWPSRRETTITTIMVFVMVALASIFFFFADQVIRVADHLCARRSNGRPRLHMSMRWYIVHAYSNFEKKVAESIREQAKQRGLEDLFEQVLVPTEKVTEVRRGRKVDAERKFFPGYVLVKMNLTDEAFHLIKNTPKVTGFLGAENKPMPISEAEAMRILHQVQEGVERPKAVGVVRDRRERPRRRRPVRVVLRRGRGNRRGPLARQGRGLDLRPRDAGGTGIRSGREGLIRAGFGRPRDIRLTPAAGRASLSSVDPSISGGRFRRKP